MGGEEVDEALVRKGLEFFLSYYREHKLDHTTVYPGSSGGAGAIQSSGNGVPRKMAVLSNKPVNPSRAIVESLGLGGFFSQIYGGNSFATKKPEPEGALKLVSEAACGRSRRQSLAILTWTYVPGVMPDCGPLPSPTDLPRTRWRGRQM